MIKSINVCESTYLLWEEVLLNELCSLAKQKSSPFVEQKSSLIRIGTLGI